MKDARELFSVHLGSLLAPASLLLLHLLLPGGSVGSCHLAFSLLSLLLTVVSLVAPFLFLCPVELRFSPVKPFRHYVKVSLSPSHTKHYPTPEIVLLTKTTFLQVFAASVVVYVFIGTLLGADPVRQFTATVVWATLMTSLTSVPAVVLLDVDLDNCARVLLHRISSIHNTSSQGWAPCVLLFYCLFIRFIGWRVSVLCHNRFVNSAERGLYIMIISALLGAWLGAVPIPLDWNRPWQVWPIPCSCGAVLGSVVGSGCSLLAQHLSLYPPHLLLSPPELLRQNSRNKV